MRSIWFGEGGQKMEMQEHYPLFSPILIGLMQIAAFAIE